MENDFTRSFERVAERCHEISREHGFWDQEYDEEALGVKIALMHSELSEVLEALRSGNPLSEKIPTFTNEEEELADTVIRVMDYSRYRNFRLAEAILAKMAYNENRPHKHGRKF